MAILLPLTQAAILIAFIIMIGVRGPGREDANHPVDEGFVGQMATIYHDVKRVGRSIVRLGR